MIEQSSFPRPVPARGFPFLGIIVLVTTVFVCSIYANLSFAVKNKADVDYLPKFVKDKLELDNLPPYKPHIDANWNHHLGAEYFNIAKSMYAGKGFSNPFNNLESGPTAWMPPVLPTLLASLLWVSDDDRDVVMAVVIFLQVFVLIGTGVLVLFLVRQVASRLWTGVAVVLFLLGMICDFHQWFQFTHDCWLVLLVLDLLVAGLCWLRPLNRWPTAAGWGLFGGFCALVNPIVGGTWGLFTLLIGAHQRRWSQLGIALLLFMLALMPWTVRNYLVFGRIFPVKPNLAYELCQSQCFQKDGLIQNKTFEQHHPNSQSAGRERQEYRTLGEMAYLDRKREQFWQSVSADPQNFIERVADRFLGATLWYEPVNRADKIKRPWVLTMSRWTHPLPFLAMLVLIFMAVWKRLPWAQWATIGVYLVYLLPYIGVSYYERYAAPLLGVKVLLVIWAVDQLLSLLPKWERILGDQWGLSLPFVGTSKYNQAVAVSP